MTMVSPQYALLLTAALYLPHVLSASGPMRKRMRTDNEEPLDTQQVSNMLSFTLAQEPARLPANRTLGRRLPSFPYGDTRAVSGLFSGPGLHSK